MCSYGKKLGVPTLFNDRIVEIIRKQEAGVLKLDKANIRLFDDLL